MSLRASLIQAYLPIFHRGADYHNILSTRKIIQENACSDDSHLGGGALGHIVIIVSAAAYTVVDPTSPWENPSFPGQAQAKI